MNDTNASGAAVRTVGSALPPRPLVAVDPGDTVFHAAKAMSEANCGSALVLSGGAIVGIVTERDVVIKVVAAGADPAATKIESVMTRRPVCARHDTPVTHALYTMRELGFRHMPVLDGERRPLGVFALRDALPGEIAGADTLALRATGFARAGEQ